MSSSEAPRARDADSGPASEPGAAHPSTAELLTSGGDARIAVDPATGKNSYDCSPFPDPSLLAFGSSTATGISELGFAGADRVRRELLHSLGTESCSLVYRRAFDRVRTDLLELCGISDLLGLDIVFAPSGTELHGICADLVRGAEASPIRVVMVDGAETGSGVPAVLGAGGAAEVVTVPARGADGTPRPSSEVDAEFESAVQEAALRGQRVLLIMVDVSKTGLIIPSPACASRLQATNPNLVSVLVDACQFRIGIATLRAYLEHDFLVALTGSKFVGGPTFSGALLLPARTAERFHANPLSASVRASSYRSDWPRHWLAAWNLDRPANVGLLLRWSAALEELRAFRKLPEPVVAEFIRSFAKALKRQFLIEPLLEVLPIAALDRSPLVTGNSWDHLPTIFPFILLAPSGAGQWAPASREWTQQVQRGLGAGVGGHSAAHEQPAGHSEANRFQIGQPVQCGNPRGGPAFALRISLSARLLVEACTGDDDSSARVTASALAALRKAALLAEKLGTQASATLVGTTGHGNFAPEQIQS